MGEVDATKPCLSLDLKPRQPDATSPFAGNVPAYTCERCGETFSEHSPTINLWREGCRTYEEEHGILKVHKEEARKMLGEAP